MLSPKVSEERSMLTAPSMCPSANSFGVRTSMMTLGAVSVAEPDAAPWGAVEGALPPEEEVLSAPQALSAATAATASAVKERRER